MVTGLRSAIFAAGYTLNPQLNPILVRNLITRLQPVDSGLPLIRIGAPNDGGYLIPNDLEGIKYCFSPGVSNIVDFENQLADSGIHSFLADASIQTPPNLRTELTFDKKFLAATDSTNTFTLASWKNKYLPDYNGDLILQMDIEGQEYEVLLNIPDALLAQFRIIVIEFHEFTRIFDPFAFRIFSACFNKLLNHFHVVHIHPNNIAGKVKRGNLIVPNFLEFTFLNRHRVTSAKHALTFPHPLDAKNFPKLPPLDLPPCWYSME